MELTLSINTIAYEGYDLSIALEELASIGVNHIELGFTRGFTEGLTEEHFSDQSARKIKQQMSDLGLTSVALSAHIDLTTPDSIDEMKRRIDFGKMLGVQVVHTKVGGVSGRKKFEENIVAIADYAKSMDLIIGLENPAEGVDQIISSGVTGSAVVQDIGSDFVKLNYDFGNAYTYSKGTLDPVEDYKKALPHACYLHLKDLKKKENGWEFSQIGAGVIDYSTIFKELVEENTLLPLSIEQIYIYQASEDFIVHRMPQPQPLAYINKNLRDSIDFVERLVGQADRES